MKDNSHSFGGALCKRGSSIKNDHLSGPAIWMAAVARRNEAAEGLLEWCMTDPDGDETKLQQALGDNNKVSAPSPRP